MQSFVAAQANTMYADIVSASTGLAIMSGTVYGRLKALTGINAGKWWNAASSTWSATTASAGSMSRDDDDKWELVVAAAAWISGVRYKFYAVESTNANIVVEEDVVEIHSAAEFAFEATVED